jgi:hypothetical protein
MFELKNGRYVEARFTDNRFWIEELGLGLGGVQREKVYWKKEGKEVTK